MSRKWSKHNIHVYDLQIAPRLVHLKSKHRERIASCCSTANSRHRNEGQEDRASSQWIGGIISHTPALAQNEHHSTNAERPRQKEYSPDNAMTRSPLHKNHCPFRVRGPRFFPHRRAGSSQDFFCLHGQQPDNDGRHQSQDNPRIWLSPRCSPRRASRAGKEPRRIGRVDSLHATVSCRRRCRGGGHV